MMNSGEMTTIARPYALAAFEFAFDKHDLNAWESMLQLTSQLVHDDLLQQVLTSPSFTEEQLYQLFKELLGATLNTERNNFIHLLAINKRLMALPDIAQLFKAYRAAAEKTLVVEVISAVELDESYRNKLIQALTGRYKQQVTLQCSVDPALLGGVMTRAGDHVIDGSVRGKLDRLIDFI